MKDIMQVKNNLESFTGTARWYRWSILAQNCLLTDGSKYLADECGAYWLMDLIASYQPALKSEDFQVWVLKKDKDGGWVAGCENGNGKVLITQSIEYSDFPLDTIKLFAARNELGGVTIMLPREY